MARKQRKPTQYTIRNVPEHLDLRLREVAKEQELSLNAAALQTLERALGGEGAPVLHHDLDDLAGSWVRDKPCESALDEMRKVDPELWR
jgi:hypothetical protein